MATPFEVIPDVFLDMRHAFIVLAGPFGGWLAVSIVALCTTAFRFWMAGPAVYVAVAGIVLSSAVATVLPRFVPFSHTPYWRLLIYGLAASTSVLSVFLLPWHAAIQALSIAGLPFMLGNLLSVICAGYLVSYQLRRDLAERQMLTESMTDSLTGVLNRRGFESIAAQKFAAARHTGEPLAILMADVDHFKKINDEYGHLVGDKILCLGGGIITRVARRTDPVSRYGGEEFAIFLPNTDEQAAQGIAERFCEAVREKPLQADGVTVPVTISVGMFVMVAGFDGTLRDAIQKTDSALYRAKRNGRDRVETSWAVAA